MRRPSDRPVAGRATRGLAPESLARRGIARTFQNLQVSINLCAIENVMVGAHMRLDSGWRPGWRARRASPRSERAVREEAAELLAFVGCGAYLELGRADAVRSA